MPAIDVWDVSEYADGQPLRPLLWLQENDPVHWHHEYEEDGPGFFALTRYEDIKKVLTDFATFSSEPTTLVSDKNQHGPSDGLHKTAIFEDPPSHTAHRKFLGQELTPQAVKRFQAQVETVADEIIDGVAERGECDLVTDVAGKLASYVTADLLGLPRQLLLDIYDIIDRINNSADLTSGQGGQAMADMGAVAGELFEAAHRDQADTLVARLARGADDGAGRPVDPIQFTMDFILFSDAGSDTTRNVVGSGMRTLFAQPDQRTRLQQDISLVPYAVEEILRTTPPIVYLRRTATRDTEIGGQQIGQGQKVCAFLAAANYDPRVFHDPMAFDVTRSPNPHFGFGAGRHLCLGSHLARQELRIMFRQLLTRLPDMEEAGPVLYLRDDPIIPPNLVGPRTLPVRFTPVSKLAEGPRPAPSLAS
jgi:cytochrome P450